MSLEKFNPSAAINASEKVRDGFMPGLTALHEEIGIGLMVFGVAEIMSGINYMAKAPSNTAVAIFISGLITAATGLLVFGGFNPAVGLAIAAGTYVVTSAAGTF